MEYATLANQIVIFVNF